MSLNHIEINFSKTKTTNVVCIVLYWLHIKSQMMALFHLNYKSFHERWSLIGYNQFVTFIFFLLTRSKLFLQKLNKSSHVVGYDKKFFYKESKLLKVTWNILFLLCEQLKKLLEVYILHKIFFFPRLQNISFFPHCIGKIFSVLYSFFPITYFSCLEKYIRTVYFFIFFPPAYYFVTGQTSRRPALYTCYPMTRCPSTASQSIPHR